MVPTAKQTHTQIDVIFDFSRVDEPDTLFALSKRLPRNYVDNVINGYVLSDIPRSKRDHPNTVCVLLNHLATGHDRYTDFLSWVFCVRVVGYDFINSAP